MRACHFAARVLYDAPGKFLDETLAIFHTTTKTAECH
jgi:hypothetical protein